MKTVKIINGTYGADNGKRGVTVIDRGQTCRVDDVEADRLVALGVADEVVATLQDGEEQDRSSKDIPDKKSPQTNAIGRLDAEQLFTMTNAKLKELAEGMGLDTRKCRVKGDYMALITAEEVCDYVDPDDTEYDSVDDGEQLPDLKAEAPVK